MTKEIRLTQNKITIVDDIEFEQLNRYKWYALKNGRTFYAMRHAGMFPFKFLISMHREILCTPENRQTDHINGNGLDNRRCNLRICTWAENQQNRGAARNNVSGYKGVSFQQGKWIALITKNKETTYIGRYSTPQEAALAYNKAAIKLHGKFAKLNVID